LTKEVKLFNDVDLASHILSMVARNWQDQYKLMGATVPRVFTSCSNHLSALIRPSWLTRHVLELKQTWREEDPPKRRRVHKYHKLQPVVQPSWFICATMIFVKCNVKLVPESPLCMSVGQQSSHSACMENVHHGLSAQWPNHALNQACMISIWLHFPRDENLNFNINVWWVFATETCTKVSSICFFFR
jgi:hypothetical protein